MRTTGPTHEVIPLFTRIKGKISDTWHHSQIGHRSEYSVERLLSFQEYYESVSFSRVLTVCFLTPIPALLAALAIDCIPLKKPSEGWQANYAVWIRLLLAMSAEALGVVFQVRAVIDPGTISIIGAVKIAIGTASASVLTTIMLAALWKFPTPFGYVLVIGPFVLFFSISTILVVGSGVLIQSPALRQQFKSQFVIVVNQGAVAVCYPIFSAVFNRLSGVQQTACVLVMPMIKFFTKQSIANAAQSYHEYVGPVVVFSVDLFNVYYIAICMQASKSIVTTLIIMVTDTFHVILALRAIFHNDNSVHVEPSGYYLRDLPVLLHLISEKEVSPSKVSKRQGRLFAPFPLPLSTENQEFMNELAQTGLFINDKAPNRRCLTALKRHSEVGPTIAALKQNQIVPASPVTPREAPPRRTMQSANNAEKSVADGLQTLFHSEYILMAEYIEFMVPMLYALYLVVLFHLPVAAYYPHTASMTVHKLHSTVTNILVYAVIEFVEFGALLVLLKRKFGVSPLYQLAFVLESQASSLQGHLFVWTITILHLTLVHYGVDLNILLHS